MHKKNWDGTSQGMQCASTRKTNTLIMCKERMAGCGCRHMDHVNTLCDQNFRFYSVKSDGM